MSVSLDSLRAVPPAPIHAMPVSAWLHTTPEPLPPAQPPMPEPLPPEIVDPDPSPLPNPVPVSDPPGMPTPISAR